MSKWGEQKNINPMAWLNTKGSHGSGRISLLGIPLLALFCLFGQVRADFEDVDMGARPLGLGGAFTALADDARTLFYNPAGLGRLRMSQLGLDYSRLHMGLTDDSRLSMGSFSYIHPLFRPSPYDLEEEAPLEKHFGEGPPPENLETLLRVEGRAMPVAKKNTPDKKKSINRKKPPEKGTLGVALQTFELAGVYKESSYNLSYGKAWGRHWSWGTSLKFLQEKYDQDAYTRLDPVFGFGSRSKVSDYGLDLGVLWHFHRRFSWGSSFLNVNRPDVGLGGQEKLPATFRTGFAYRDKTLRGGLDLIVRDGQRRVGTGVERWFKKKTLATRFGTVFGQDGLFDVTAGFSVSYSLFQLDYAFLFPLSGIESNGGSHRVSLTYGFGAVSLDSLSQDSLEYSYETLKKEKAELALKLKKAELEKERLENVLVEEAAERVYQRLQDQKKGVVRVSGAPVLRKGFEIRAHYAQPGDTLRKLAVRYYGDAKKWEILREANREKLTHKGRIKEGTVLLIPFLEEKKASPKKPKQKPRSKKKPSSMKKKTPAPKKKPDSVKKAKTVKKSKTHRVQEGETLKSIAKKVYGDSKRWTEIYKANKGKVSRGSVKPGTELFIP